MKSYRTEIKAVLEKKQFNEFTGYFLPEILNIRNNIYADAQHFFNNVKSPKFGDFYDITNNIEDYVYYSYERNISHSLLENSYSSGYIKNSYNKTVFFNSGIATIFNTLSMLKRILNKKQLNVLSHSSYFETSTLHNILMNNIIDFNSDSFKDNIDVIFIETIQYDENMQTFNLMENLNFIIEKLDTHKVLFIIIDSTLFRDAKGLNRFINNYLGNDIIIIEIISLLKLHQFGMEISNVGVATIYSTQTNHKVVDNIAIYLKKMRNVTGSNLSLYEISLLSNEIFFDNDLINLYKNYIYSNSRYFANALKKGNIITKICYTWSLDYAAPFIILKNNEYDLQDYIRILSIIKYLIEKEDLNIFMGSSFGFNNTRYELIITNKETKSCFIKIAVGAFDCTAQEKFIIILNNINACISKNELFLKYRNIPIIQFGEDYE